MAANNFSWQFAETQIHCRPPNQPTLPFSLFISVSKEIEMQLPRRGFLKTGALTAVTAGLAVGGARFAFAQGPGRPRTFAIPLKVEGDPVFSFTKETFEPYVGGIFQVPNARGEMINIILVEVSGYKPKRNTKITTKLSQEVRSFSLSFTS